MQYQELLTITTEREFLSWYKTLSCTNNIPHNQKDCSFHHNDYDHRRNPYSIKNQIMYIAERCQLNQLHDWKQCHYSHNDLEFNYHPLRYKTQGCINFYDCNLIFCSFNHHNSLPINQFARFDIKTFKTYQCNKQFAHDKKICLYYHNNNDKRRPNFQIYQHVECQTNNCKKGETCQFSHNKIEQLYHPSRYKSKFCEQVLKKKICQYGQFCSFAHNNSQITIKLIGDMQKNSQFQIYQYKTVWCPLTIDHNRSQCVYAHNIQDFRRDPRVYDYQPIKCSYWKVNDKIKSLQQAGCTAGMQCKYCHGWKQYDFHPLNYKKQNLHQLMQPKRKGSCKIGQQAIHIKLGMQSTKLGQNKINNIINQHLKTKHKNTLYSNGVPFFKTGQTNSHSSKTTKAKSQHYNSGSQNDKISQIQERGSVANFHFQFRTPKHDNYSVMADEDQIYGIFKLQDAELNDQKRERNISKSCGKNQQYQIQYSQQIVNLIDHNIIEKLKKGRINEIKLLNLKEQQVFNLICLTPNEKAQLAEKIKELSLFKNDKIKYSNTLQIIFQNSNIKACQKNQEIREFMNLSFYTQTINKYKTYHFQLRYKRVTFLQLQNKLTIKDNLLLQISKLKLVFSDN